MSMKRKTYSALTYEWQTIPEISEKADLTRSQASTALAKLKRLGDVEKSGYGEPVSYRKKKR